MQISRIRESEIHAHARTSHRPSCQCRKHTFIYTHTKRTVKLYPLSFLVHRNSADLNFCSCQSRLVSDQTELIKVMKLFHWQNSAAVFQSFFFRWLLVDWIIQCNRREWKMQRGRTKELQFALISKMSAYEREPAYTHTHTKTATFNLKLEKSYSIENCIRREKQTKSIFLTGQRRVCSFLLGIQIFFLFIRLWFAANMIPKQDPEISFLCRLASAGAWVSNHLQNFRPLHSLTV